jgi:3-oxoacyl-[acyl-carrier protein] reductase
MGLGKAMAEHLFSTGYDVVACSRSMAPDIAPYGAVSLRCDVSDERDVERMVNDARQFYGHVDVLVNNAAVYGPVAQIDDTDSALWLRVMKINLYGPMLCARAVLPMMRRRGHGKIINVSGAGVRPQKECTAYNASKAGLLRFTEALAVDLDGTGIDVNSVAPGTLDTRMRLRSAMPEDPERAMAQAVEMIAWLASDESDGVTGRFFSAVWDDVGNLPIPLGKDDFRMRRVVPE